MFYLFLIVNTYLIFNVYKKYFKINLYIIFGYIILNFIMVYYIYNNNIIDSIIFYYILIFLYLSFIIDIKEMWISDLTIICILVLNILKVLLNYFFYKKDIVYEGMLFIIILIILLVILQLIFKKELMGFGDLKLFFVLSINSYITDTIYLLMLSSIIGIIYYYIFKKQNEFPFGPSIIIAYVVLELINKN